MNVFYLSLLLSYDKGAHSRSLFVCRKQFRKQEKQRSLFISSAESKLDVTFIHLLDDTFEALETENYFFNDLSITTKLNIYLLKEQII